MFMSRFKYQLQEVRRRVERMNVQGDWIGGIDDWLEEKAQKRHTLSVCKYVYEAEQTEGN